MPADERLCELVILIKGATAAERLRWEATPDPAEFKAKLPHGWIWVLRDQVRDGTGEWPGREFASITVRDAGGAVIEQWSGYEGEDFRLIEEVHLLARRKALRVEEKLASVFEDLRNLLPADSHGNALTK